MTDARIVTILFTDLVGSTELNDRLGDEAAEQIRRTHFGLLREAVQARGGQEVKNLGDGLMVVFGSAVQAVACAVDMQRAVERRNQRPDARHHLAVRVGLHVGEPIEDEGDYFGSSVNVAKRLCDVAQGAQILCSDLVRGLARTRSEVEFRPLGAMELKGIAEPVEPSEIVWAPRRNDVPLPASLVAPSRTPYVGRETEREALRSAWKAVASGEPRTILIAGEPGIGKTRLSTEAAREAHDGGATVLHGRCDEESVVPYQPFVEALRFYSAHCAADDLREQMGEFGPDLARLIPEVRERVAGLPSPTELDPEAERYRLFLAVGRVLTEAAKAAPLFLLIDDLHWADRPTLALLKHVVRAQGPVPLLICGTYRDVELGRRHPFAEVLADLRRDQAYERVLLRGLSQDEIVALLEAFSEQSVDERGAQLAGALHTETEGNPFFIEEILRHLTETGRLYQDAAGRWTSDVGDIGELEIPEGVREAVGRRLARLSDAANDALAAASVVGPRFTFAVLAQMTATDEDSLPRALEEALSAQLVVDTSDVTGPSYGFAHAIVRQVLYEELSLPRRQRMHLRAGDALAAIHPKDVPFGAIASHYRSAGAAADRQKAIDYSLFAGQQASTVYAFEDALRHLEAARELMEEGETAPDIRARLLRYLGDLRYVTGLEYEKGISALDDALRIYEASDDRIRAAQIHARLGRAFSTFPGWMKIGRALDHFRSAQQLLEGEEETTATAYTYIGLAGAALWASNHDEGLAAAERAMQIGERLDRRIVWANAAVMHGWHLSAKGLISDGIAEAEQAYEIADGLEHTATAFLAVWTRCFTVGFLGDVGDAIVWVDREMARPRMQGAPNLRLRLEMLLAQTLYGAGDRQRLEALSLEVGDLGPIAGAPANYLRLIDGDWEETYERSQELVAIAHDSGSRFEIDLLEFSLATISLCAGKLSDAERHARTLLRRDVHAMGAVVVRGFLIGIYGRQGRGTEAEALLDEMRAYVENGQDWRCSHGMFNSSQGTVASLKGDHDGAEQHFLNALQISRRYHNILDQAGCLVDFAVSRRAAGDERRARVLVDEAVELVRAHGFGEPWTVWARSVLS